MGVQALCKVCAISLVNVVFVKKKKLVLDVLIRIRSYVIPTTFVHSRYNVL